MKHHQTLTCTHYYGMSLIKKWPQLNRNTTLALCSVQEEFSIRIQIQCKETRSKSKDFGNDYERIGRYRYRTNAENSSPHGNVRVKKTPHVNPYVLDMVEQGKLNRLEIDFYYTDELEFVDNKENQRWTRYAIDRGSGIILAWHNGKRTDADFWYCYIICLKSQYNCIVPTIWGLIPGICRKANITS